MNLKLIFAGLTLSTGTVLAAESAAEPKETNFTIEGVQRTALIVKFFKEQPATRAAKSAAP
jgi:hypothetical protein